MLLFDDAISIKAQKPERKFTAGEAPENPKSTPTSHIFTNVVVQIAPKQYEYVSSPIDSYCSLSLTLAQAGQVKVQCAYGEIFRPLHLVVISDEASSIRKPWKQAFGDPVVIILNWYHLMKKLQGLMTMIAWSKTEKQAYLKLLFAQLWTGQTQQAIDYITYQVIPRHHWKWQKLLTYLDKH